MNFVTYFSMTIKFLLLLLLGLVATYDHVCKMNVIEPVSKQVNVTRQVPYTIIKDGRNQTTWRVEADWETQTVLQWGFREVCCDGYEGAISNCTAHCENCPKNSDCVAPETCHCQLGYRAVAKSKSCEPVCKVTCPEYSYCKLPDVCACLKGYRVTNNRCLPKCSQDCGLDGVCVAPDKCGCRREGYIMNAEGKCVPGCDPPCVNARCLASGKCACYRGYKLSTQGKCEPVCEPSCVHGQCLAPGQCSCDKGYDHEGANNTWTCLPFCVTCEFGDCVAPNTCKCWEGYEAVKGEGCKALPPTDALFPASHCVRKCTCLQRYPKPKGKSKSKCVRVCAKGVAKPCLDLERCRCNKVTRQLSCNNTRHYVCKETQPKLTTTSSPEIRSGPVETEKKTQNPLTTVLGGGLLVLVFAVAVAGAIFFYIKRRNFLPLERD